MVEIWIVPKRRRRSARCAEKARVFGVGDLRGREQKSVGPHAMNWTLAILAGRRTHQKPGRWDLDQRRFDGQERSFGAGWSERHDVPRFFLHRKVYQCQVLKGRVDILTAQLFHDCDHVVFLKQADGRDARSSGCETGTGILQRDSSEGEDWDVGETGLAQKF
jgi:hypothetical protein